MSYESSATGASISSRSGVHGDGGINGTWGVLGTADNNAAGIFYSDSGGGSNYTLVAVNLDGPPLYVTNGANGSGCWVDYDGNLNCTGAKHAVVPVDGGEHEVALSAIESPKTGSKISVPNNLPAAPPSSLSNPGSLRP